MRGIKVCECAGARIPSKGGEVDRALRPGLAALRVARYPAVEVVRRGEILNVNM